MKQQFPIAGILKALESEQDFVFLDSASSDSENQHSYLFLRPLRIISTERIDQVSHCLAQMQEALKAGYYVAGYISYEAGAAFEENLSAKISDGFPLLWFGVYQQPWPTKIKHWQKRKPGSFTLKKVRPNITLAAYRQAITRIKQLIAQGFTYQVNYTFKLKFAFNGSLAGLYLRLRENQPVPYAAWLRTSGRSILSFSPELFFRKDGDRLLTRPMKGTAGRGKNTRQDHEHIQALQGCPKNRSENVMIVDLLRNDLGRISATGSVTVPRLFKVEKYATLLQMTSDIKSRLGKSFSELIFSGMLFLPVR